MKQNIHTHQTAFIKNVCKIFFTFLMLALCINVNAQIIKTIAGNGTQGYVGDGGQATSAKFNSPSDVVIDASGNLYITDFFNHRIRKISTDGIITTVAGNGIAGHNGDGGLATSAQVGYPHCLAIDNAGNLYVSQEGDYYHQNQQILYDCVRKIDINGIITTVAGGTQGYSGDGGLAVNAQLWSPCGLKADAAGNLFIADANNHVIRKVDVNGFITTMAGVGSTSGYNGDGLPATSAKLHTPCGITLDNVGNLYIADIFNYRVRKVDTNGIITTVAGTGTLGYSGDGGQATQANLWHPVHVIVDTLGNLYISDMGKHCVRKVDTNGIITTIAGNGSAGYSGDCGQATEARLRFPFGIALGANNTMYIADESNHCVRVLYNPEPVSISASAVNVCAGETATLSASGANSYTWNTHETNTSISVTPSVSTIYLVQATDNYGCQNNQLIVISVSPCTDIDELKDESLELRVYPNPTNRMLNISPLTPKGGTVEVFVYDVLGNTVIHNPTLIIHNSARLDVSELEKGIYFIKVGNKTQKFVKE